MKKNVFIGSAWPYANGPLHIGHVSALLPSDILARYHRLCGDSVLFVSGSDCHGTPISVRAEREHTKPERIAEIYHDEFRQNFLSMGFSHDIYGATTSRSHREEVQEIFLALYTNGFIEKKKDVGFYSEKDKRFLPDRFVEGECPYCHFNGARGDQCDACGRLLDPKDLLNLKSKLSGDTPVQKETEHFYLKLSSLQSDLRKYISSIRHLRKNTKQFIQNFLADGLHDRAITRDLDWGIPLPKELGDGYSGKRIYVWFEAVCGYLTMSKQWATKTPDADQWKKFWVCEPCTSYYVYGKDNIPFHTIIWPAILLAYSKSVGEPYHLPDVHVSSEYMQIEGEKLSTSRNWAVWLPDLLKDFSQESIRYALIALGPENSDTNFSFKEFQSKNNNELVATIGNYIQRIVTLSKKAGISDILKITDPAYDISALYERIGDAILNLHFKDAIGEILKYAKFLNTDLDVHQPWKSTEQGAPEAREYLVRCCRRALELGILLEPFIPSGAQKIRKLFSAENIAWMPHKGNAVLLELDGPLFPKVADADIQKHEKLLYAKALNRKG